MLGAVVEVVASFVAVTGVVDGVAASSSPEAHPAATSSAASTAATIGRVTGWVLDTAAPGGGGPRNGTEPPAPNGVDLVRPSDLVLRAVRDDALDVRYVAECTTPVRRAAMVHWWDELTFLHWRFEPEAVQRLLPDGLRVETFDGSAWVGLVPFFLRVGLPGVPSVPWLSRFAETNVRTYVQGADGTTGIWFFSLDAARLGAVVTARTTYRLPYFWARMSLDRSGTSIDGTGSTVTYSCRRRWPGPIGASSRAVIEIGDRFAPDELTELDHFLTARWALYSAPRSGLRHARAFHDPWPLHRGEVVELHDELVVAAGLPEPQGDPIVHWSPSVEVRIGWPRRIRQPAATVD